MATTPVSPVASLPAIVRLREIITDNDLTWDQAWKENVTPWDMGDIQPPLRDVIQSGEIDLPQKGRALVPGCGRGYDAIFLASTLGLDTLAIDISSTAVQAANNNLASLSHPPTAKVSFEKADFFSFKVPDTEQFDLIYDYTFFVAIPPARRMEWGRQMAALIKPGGYLITLVYPLDPPNDLGPPYFILPEHYLESLGERWDKVLDKIPEVSMKTHVGRERIVVWKRI